MRGSISLLLFAFLFLSNGLSGQEEPIRLINPSFEGVPGEGGNGNRLPDGWYDCGFPGETPPDVHPKEGVGAFQVTKAPFNGKTYIGLVVRENDTWERVSQRLSGQLVSGKCYEFSMSLTRSEVYMSASRVTNLEVNYAAPVKLRIWGGSSYCSRDELLAESSLIVNTRWLAYNFRFEPKQTHSYITFEAFYKTPTPFPYNGNLLLDNASDIFPVPCSATKPDVPVIPDTPPVVSGPRNTTSTEKSDSPEVKKTPAILKELEDPTKITTGMTIRMEQLYFPADSSTITKSSVPVLSEVYDFLTANPRVAVEIGGHTNGTPSHEYCDKLSTERAKAIVDYLVEKGIARKRLQYKGYGKRKPVDTNKTAAGRKKNQRVEIKILSVTG
ncbi:MAG: OmpA family protein [Saprospiraceae bacterium]|nr:OmpA family protein [Saprospiraceae bacterium]MCF8249071.1 OmpA family protein [Saprospiraceae bacterium]MCF8280938.1 OmpA family protein [Bacteroidales bacterium]MCF8311093.1 OmpA family protein [Saprospiraceae bacterium]MCF8440183.1 OmpA family protein [Saprospiraceae bacterium]